MGEKASGQARGEGGHQTSDEFRLGKPALVCRWRIQNGRLPMANRHLRALGKREVNGVSITTELVAWAKQHVEWTLQEGSAEHPDGVLMLIVDEKGQAAMAVGDFEPLADQTLRALLVRARAARLEGSETGVAPESLWLVQDGALVWDVAGDHPSGTATLVEDLARTLGITLRRVRDLEEKVRAGSVTFDEAFLVSDEYGIVPASDRAGEMGQRLVQSYNKLLTSMKRS